MIHGTIMINGQQIGHWSAICRTPVGSRPGIYDAELTEGDLRYEATVTHDYEDGASVLAARVLALRPAGWPVPVAPRSLTHREGA